MHLFEQWLSSCTIRQVLWEKKNTKLFCKPEISEGSEAAHSEITTCMISISQNSASVTLQPP